MATVLHVVRIASRDRVSANGFGSKWAVLLPEVRSFAFR
jgi:hypothetical protein